MPPPESYKRGQESNDVGRTVCNVALSSLNTSRDLFTISQAATSRRVRLLACSALTEEGVLRIIEFTEFHTARFSAVSYPWRGVSVDQTLSGHTFAVERATDADPIGCDTLRHACTASLQRRCPYLWMDRLCINYADQDDKDWHIGHMIDIYRTCRLCILLPGGAQRLARLSEETSWIHRSWTLMETLAPSNVVVLFQWKLGAAIGEAETESHTLDEVIPGQSVIAPLILLLYANTIGYLSYRPLNDEDEDEDEDEDAPPTRFSTSTVPVSIFVAFPTGHAPDGTPFWKLQHKIRAPNIIALIVALTVGSDHEILDYGAFKFTSDENAHAVWQCALMRTASRPADMVFSIMGLFDVSLDPAAFHPDDIRGPSIALAQAILGAGWGASWLGAAFGVDPGQNRMHSALPVFPYPAVDGPALVQTRAGVREVGAVVCQPVVPQPATYLPFPQGTMDSSGRFTFTARTIRLYPIHAGQDERPTNMTVHAQDGSRWIASESSNETPNDCLQALGDLDSLVPAVYGAASGWFDEFEVGMVPAMRDDNIRVMLMQEHSPGMVHLRSFFCLNRSENNNVLAWRECEFCLEDHQVTSGSDDLSPQDALDIQNASIQNMGDGYAFRISSTATPCRVRLVDCEALVEQGTLRIVEFPTFPATPYSAISYPWLGVAADPTLPDRSFLVEGAEFSDPVNIAVLEHACTASLMRGCAYLWLDRLCIDQTDRFDKNWQIQHMYRLYKSCRLCIVLAGGLRRLVRLDEETPWIHRSWTLQEVLAPPDTVVLFSWKLGWGMTWSAGVPGPIQEVVPGVSAMAALSMILQACVGGSLAFSPSSLRVNDGAGPRQAVRVVARIFGARPSAAEDEDEDEDEEVTARIFAPNVVALSIAMDPALKIDPDTLVHAAWQSALMRTSSRPVDMVFSIMGLFGVTLDVDAFDKDDRRGATIALAQAILEAGGSASWLGSACRIPPDRCLSTFPTFPRTSVAGVAMVRTPRCGRMREVSQVVGHPVYPVSGALVPLPRGMMDDAGYLSITVRAVRLSAAESSMVENSVTGMHMRVHEALDGSRWVVESSPEGPGGDGVHLCAPAVYGALLGWFNRYFPDTSPVAGPDNIAVMVLEEHGPATFHLRSFFFLGGEDRRSVLAWTPREFRVGGPDALGSSSPELQSVSTNLGEHEALPHAARPAELHDPSLRETAMERARRALPQRTLEQQRRDALSRCTDEFFLWRPSASLTGVTLIVE
ncbi:hypothetical protein C8Q80DRAFT_1259326 [Daedaleopsis nitida]|nr:hypothetical protein C8Q80DRAFT_1259326 [Daedaleopsis nitida]